LPPPLGVRKTALTGRGGAAGGDTLPRRATMSTKYVYSFGGGTADGDGRMKDLLGGKGANLAEMCKIGIPVPPGFTITTEVCAAFYDNGKKIPEDAIPQINEALAKMEALAGMQSGQPA